MDSMLSLLILVIFGIFVAFFATQNTQSVGVTLVNMRLSDIPMYAVVLGAMLFGILISSIISIVNSIANSLTLMGKEGKIKNANRSIDDLTKRIRQLELENERLKTEKKVVTTTL